MGDNSLIQWTNATWNPVTGCTKVSQGCERCYIERTVPFRAQGRRFAGPNGPEAPGATTGVVLHPERIDQPLRWRRPRRVFVNSLSDLFHPAVPDGFVAEVFETMALAERHTFQVLTKRPSRMRSLLNQERFRLRIEATRWQRGREPYWPPRNVWLGVSVEDQRAAELRIPTLLATPAAVRFLSCEPLLGPVDLAAWMPAAGVVCARAAGPLTQGDLAAISEFARVLRRAGGQPTVDWVIVGGESGPGARVMDLAWARSLLAQCRAAGVAVFVKQLGRAWSIQAGLGAGHGGDPAHWPVDLRVRELHDRLPSAGGW
jgi:protein gp37